MDLVDALKTYRTAHRLTQKELAAKLGISREHYARIESGKFRPSFKLTKQISRTLRLTITVVHSPTRQAVQDARESR